MQKCMFINEKYYFLNQNHSILLQRLALKVTTMPNHDFFSRSKNVLMQNCPARTLHSQYQFFDTAAFADTGEEFVKDFVSVARNEWTHHNPKTLMIRPNVQITLVSGLFLQNSILKHGQAINIFDI